MQHRILAIGDPHFKSDNKVQTDVLYTEIERVVTERLEEIDAVVVLGDILHRHEKVDMFPFMRAVKFLRMIRTILSSSPVGGKQLWILIGNHDRPNNSTFCTDEHVFNSLKDWDNTVVADTPILATLPRDETDYFLLVPYVYPGRFSESLGCGNVNDLVDGEDGSVLGVFAHQEFRGANLGGGGVVSTIGDIYPPTSPFCVSGHIHQRDRLSSNVHYVGTPYTIGWGEASECSIEMFTFSSGNPVTSERIFLKRIPENFSMNYTSAAEFIVSYERAALLMRNFIIRDSYRGSPPKLWMFMAASLSEHDEDSIFKLISTGSSFESINKVRVNVKCKDSQDYGTCIVKTSDARGSLLKEGVCVFVRNSAIRTASSPEKALTSQEVPPTVINKTSFKDRVKLHLTDSMPDDEDATDVKKMFEEQF